MNQLKALFLFILLACSLNITAQRIKGSDTVLPVSQETAEVFMKDDPDRRVTVTGGGTGVGISALWTTQQISLWLPVPSNSAKR